MRNRYCVEAVLPSFISFSILNDTLGKIQEQFYEWSYMESQFVTYDEKSDMVVEFVYDE